ncbi:MAG: sugar transferase [Actinobacteria bacterium]|nr:sugar transferase [Actinomycetota bacterium]
MGLKTPAPSRSAVGRWLHRVPDPLDRRRGLYERYGKRPCDVLGASLLICLVSPVLVASWFALRLTLGPSVVITQERVGKDGHIFGMYKFRTMRWSRRRARCAYDGPDRRTCHKNDNDPRHTTIGRMFRKASLDELPQFFNVLRGDMSLVGPRPELASVIEEFGGRDHGRHTVRPGITGEWQITTRKTGALLHECFDEDLPYLNRITFRNDVRILFATFAVVAGRGGH